MAPYEMRVRSRAGKLRLHEAIHAINTAPCAPPKSRIRKQHSVLRRGRIGQVIIQAHIPPRPIEEVEAEQRAFEELQEFIRINLNAAEPEPISPFEEEILVPESDTSCSSSSGSTDSLDQLREQAYTTLLTRTQAQHPVNPGACPSMHLTTGIPRDCIAYQCAGTLLYEHGWNVETEASERAQLEEILCGC